MWAIQSADCEDERTFRAGEIKNAHQAFKVSSKAYKTCNDSLDRAEVDHGQCETDTLDTSSARTALVNIREGEATRFHDSCEKHDHAITIIEDAINFLDQLVSGEASLLELSQHTMNFIRVGRQTGHMHLVAPLVSLFAQMAASEQDAFVDSTAVERCRAMM